MNCRCDWSDLPIAQCAHCLGHGQPLIEPEVRHSEPAPASPVWPTAAQVDSLKRPALPNTWMPQAGDGDECRCGKPARDAAYLCDECRGDFHATLQRMADLDDEITTTMTRQSAVGVESGARSATTPLPWHEKAADARRTLHGLLAMWVRFCDEERVRGPVLEFPADRIGPLATWLATRVDGLALMDIAPVALEEITDAAAECHRLVFWKRKARVYLGTCGTELGPDEHDDEPGVCPGEVYADDGDPVGWCDDCGQGVTVVIRRGELERELDGRLYTAAEIARLSTFLGLDAPRDAVRKRVLYWHRHKRIVARSRTESDSPMFRYGEVKTLLYAEFAARGA